MPGGWAVYAAQTNGSGGGPWHERNTWAGGKPPAIRDSVTVMPGDKLLIAGPRKARCGPLLIESGGSAAFEGWAGRLVCAGDVDVKGSLVLGPGSGLRVDCSRNMQYGIFVAPSGALLARGSHGFDRNCFLGANRRDGKHNTFIRVERGARASFRFCDVSYLGGRAVKGGRNRLWSGLFLWVNVTVEGCHFHHCHNGIHAITGGASEVRHNLFTDNREGVFLYRPGGIAVTGNVFRENTTGMRVGARHTQASGSVHGNLFEKNKTGMLLYGFLARSAFYDNLYVDNEVGLELRSHASADLSAPVAKETFAGNAYDVRLAPKTLGVRLLSCVFGMDTDGARPARTAEVRVAAPGPSGLVLESCRFAEPPRVVFDAAPDKEKDASRWVVSNDHNGMPGKTEKWHAPGPKTHRGEKR